MANNLPIVELIFDEMQINHQSRMVLYMTIYPRHCSIKKASKLGRRAVCMNMYDR